MVIGPTPPGTGVIAPATARRFREGDVADDAGLALAARGRHAVDADVDHDGARLDPVAAHELRPADGGDEDVGAPADVRQVAACANGRWSPCSSLPSSSWAIGLPTMFERPTTTASSPASVGAHALASSSSAAERRAGDEARRADRQPPGIHRVEAVDVLGRIDRLDHLSRVDLLAAAAAARGCRGPAGSALSRAISARRSASGGRGRRACDRRTRMPASAVCLGLVARHRSGSPDPRRPARPRAPGRDARWPGAIRPTAARCGPERRWQSFAVDDGSP